MDLAQLAALLRGIDVPKLVGPVMSRAGGNMVRDMRAHAPAERLGTHLPRYQSDLQFRKHGRMVVEAGAFGTGKGHQGDLAAILEFGQGPNAAHPHIIPALDREAPHAAKWVGQVVADALRK